MTSFSKLLGLALLSLLAIGLLETRNASAGERTASAASSADPSNLTATAITRSLTVWNKSRRPANVYVGHVGPDGQVHWDNPVRLGHNGSALIGVQENP